MIDTHLATLVGEFQITAVRPNFGSTSPPGRQACHLRRAMGGFSILWAIVPSPLLIAKRDADRTENKRTTTFSLELPPPGGPFLATEVEGSPSRMSP